MLKYSLTVRLLFTPAHQGSVPNDWVIWVTKLWDSSEPVVIVLRFIKRLTQSAPNLIWSISVPVVWSDESQTFFSTNSFHQTEWDWHFMVMRQQNLWWRWKSATLVDSDWTFEAHHHLRTSKQHLDQGVVRQCGTLGLGQQTSSAIEVCEVWVFFSGFAYSPLQFLSSGVHVQVCSRTKHSWNETTEAATSQNKIHMEPARLKNLCFLLKATKEYKSDHDVGACRNALLQNT